MYQIGSNQAFAILPPFPFPIAIIQGAQGPAGSTPLTQIIPIVVNGLIGSTGSTTPVMLGLNKTFKPNYSTMIGTAVADVFIANNTAVANMAVVIGTGTPPANGAGIPASGQVLTVYRTKTAGAASYNTPIPWVFTQGSLDTTQTYWIDIAFYISSGTVSFSDFQAMLLTTG